MKPMSIVPFSKRSCHFEFHTYNKKAPVSILLCETEPALAIVDSIAYRSTSVKLARMEWPDGEIKAYLKNFPGAKTVVFKRPRFLRTLFDRMLGELN